VGNINAFHTTLFPIFSFLFKPETNTSGFGPKYIHVIRPFTFLLAIATLFAAITMSYGQELTGTAAALKIEGALRVRMNKSGTTPGAVVFDPAKALPLSEMTTLQQRLFGSRPEDSWTIIRSLKDQAGITHVRCQQQYKNIPVDGFIYLFHSKDGKITSANGEFAPQINLSVEAAISQGQALEFAVSGMKNPVSPTILENQDAKLVIAFFEGKPMLVYACTLVAQQPLTNVLLYIDANSGNVLQEVNRLCATDVPGTAHTHFSGVRPITTNEVSPGNYELSESGRNMQTNHTVTGAPYTDSDNIWNNVNADMDEFAGDVHFGVETVYDYYLNNFNHTSYDNNGSLIRTYANDTWTGPNAYWSPSPDNAMHYGTGDTSYFPFASLEVVGHEFTHGVTEHSSNLAYYGESGALNESFSDIFGNTIRFLNMPNVATWDIGDQLPRPGSSVPVALRSMADPNQYGSPDTYDGQYFNDGDVVHFNSGIQNYWYYLLVEGGNGSNDIGNTYSVTGIGLNDAMRIAYHNLVYYLTPHSTFLDARYGSEQAAIDLFGMCSPQHMQTLKAWYAVGVGPEETTLQPEAAYQSTNDFACSAPLTTQFAAAGNYTSYHWNFGDGQTSTLQNPVHTYALSGFYTVTLIVSTGMTCQDPDTLIVANGVVIGQVDPIAGFTTQGPLVPGDAVDFTDASLYGPTSWSWNFGDGGTSTMQNPSHTYNAAGDYNVQLTVENCHGIHTITQVVHVADYIMFCNTAGYVEESQGVIVDDGGPNGNYGSDKTCSVLLRPCNASLITLNFEELNLQDGYDYLYLYDNEFVMIGMVTGNTPPGPITTTTGRIIMDFYSDSQNEESGFKIRYTTETNGAAGPGTTQFTSIPETISAPGEFVQFLDESDRPGVSWLWNFGDGTTSQQQHPDHTYFQQGTYNVTLTVTYCDGFVDTRTMVHYVGYLGVEELAVGELLRIAPNPFSQSFFLMPEKSISKVELRMCDMSGREVYTESMDKVGQEGIMIDPAGLSNGQYLLEVAYSMDGAERIERQRIQVQR
jgi:Zn-dependent metalloprotease/chitodextrinase